jgi:uncharacterized membrane protein (UPF0127 family)
MSARAEQNAPEEKPRGEAGRSSFLASSPWLPTAPDFADDQDDRHDEKGTKSPRRSKVPDRSSPAVRASVLTLVLLLLDLAGCNGGSTDSGSTGTTSESRAATTTDSGNAPASDLRTVTIDASGGGEVEVRVEIADDTSEQMRGFMHRTALAEDRGMLFVFPDEQIRSFWMKNTLIPLSIAYIDSEGRIVDIQDMKSLDDDPPHYVSAEPARYALEVNQGFFEERGMKVGDRAELPN